MRTAEAKAATTTSPAPGKIGCQTCCVSRASQKYATSSILIKPSRFEPSRDIRRAVTGQYRTISNGIIGETTAIARFDRMMSEMAILRQLSERREHTMIRRGCSHEHFYSSDILDHGHLRVFGFPHNPDLGMGTMAKSAEAAQHLRNPVHDRFCSCDGFSSACGFVSRLRSIPSLPILRPTAAEDISNRNLAISRRNCLRG